MRTSWIVVLALGCGGSGDDKAPVPEVPLGEATVLSVWPVKKAAQADGTTAWVPACYGGAAALRSDVAVPDGTRVAGGVAVQATPAALAILIDQSGSITGLVDRDTCLEGSEGSFDLAEDLTRCASDAAGLRLVAAKTLAAGAGDATVTYAFSEAAGCAKVADVDVLQGTAAGRSNLWACMDEVIAAEPGKDIVVITDGPDTCLPDAEDFQRCFTIDDALGLSHLQDACAGATSFDEVRATLEKGAVRVSFIQLQSKGYPAPDPRMVQAACLSGGSYAFLAFNAMAQGERKPEILGATSRVQALRGSHWLATEELPKSSPGALILRGSAAYVMPCTSEADCAGGDCGPRCSQATATCRAPANGTDCSGGICCGGQCDPGKQVCPDLDKGSPGAPGACP